MATAWAESELILNNGKFCSGQNAHRLEEYYAKKKDEITVHSSAAEYLTYVAAVGDNADSMEMRYEDENIWLTQKMMAELYEVSVSAKSK